MNAGSGPQVVVAIPTLVAGEALEECLASLSRQTYRNFKVVVVDNSGCGLAKNSNAFVMEMPTNVGFGAAVNRAWESADAPLLATLNDDASASPEWIAALVEASEQFPEAGMFASRVELAGSGTLDSAGMLLCADGSSKQRGHGEPSSRFDVPQEVLLPSGSAALYRASMLREIGGFDPNFFLYCEDTDLGLRARRAGWSCRYVPSARVTHRYSHSAGRVSALKAYYVERNRLFVVAKNFPLALLLQVPFSALGRYFWHMVFLLRGKGAAAQFAAEGSAAWHLPWLVMKGALGSVSELGPLAPATRRYRPYGKTVLPKLPPVAGPAFDRRAQGGRILSHGESSHAS